MKYTQLNKNNDSFETPSSITFYNNKENCSYDLHIIDNRTYNTPQFKFWYEFLFHDSIDFINDLQNKHGFVYKIFNGDEYNSLKDEYINNKHIDKYMICYTEDVSDKHLIIIETFEKFEYVLNLFIDFCKNKYYIKYFKEQYYKDYYVGYFNDGYSKSDFPPEAFPMIVNGIKMSYDIYYSFGGVSVMEEIDRQETLIIVNGFYDENIRTPMVKLISDNPNPDWEKTEEEKKTKIKWEKWQETIKNFLHYRSICFKYHGKKCLVCDETVVIDVHHIDKDRTNDNPDNLVPLCPTHHRYLKSNNKNKTLVESKIKEYINKFNKGN